MVSMLAATAALFTGMVAQVPPQQPPTPALIVTGTSEVRIMPDLATLTLGVTTQAKTAQQAQNESNAKAAAFLAEAKRLLGNKGTVQTGTINLYPVYSEQTRPTNAPFTPEITGYRADNTLTVRTTDFTIVGPIIDAAVTAGLNTVQGLTFGLQDDTDARMEALANAVKQARKKAEVMAGAADVEIAGVWDISEGGGRVMPFQADSFAGKAMSAAVATPVEPGAVTVNGDVTIRFFIRPRH
ncbi:MAG: uncharacterized protein QOJ65_2513 [Fimbriimonadaceae bacterium]|jgi:uncharacterized protein YggE|nr:uncharacterized protein [Fimbriimonadaceae bacterium]